MVDRRIPLALAALLVPLAGSCAPAVERAHDVAVEIAFEPAPHVGETQLCLLLTDDAGSPLAGADLEVEGNMNHAGMVPVFANPGETEPGRYEGQLEFTMGGDWFLIVRGELEDGRRIEEIVDLPGVPVEIGGEPCTGCCQADPVE